MGKLLRVAPIFVLALFLLMPFTSGLVLDLSGSKDPSHVSSSDSQILSLGSSHSFGEMDGNVIPSGFSLVTGESSQEKFDGAGGGSSFRIDSIIGTPPPGNGDWNISDTTVVENESLTIYYNINVLSGGALVIKNSTFEMWPQNSINPLVIRVFPGGNLTILNSTISYYGAYYGRSYSIVVEHGSVFHVINSTISGPGTFFTMAGIYVNSSDVMLINNTFTISVSVMFSLNNVSGAEIFGNSFVGIAGKTVVSITNSVNLTIRNNVFSSVSRGIQFTNVNLSLITDNTFSGLTNDAIALFHSYSNTIVGNNLTGTGILVFDSYENTFTSNILNGKPILYLEGESDREVSAGFGEVIVVSSNNISIVDFTVTESSRAIIIENSSLITMRNLVIANHIFSGIFSHKSNNLIIENVSFSGNQVGIELHDSRNVSISKNEFVSIGNTSIVMSNTIDALITHNTLKNFHFGGIWVVDSEDIQIINNTLVNEASASLFGISLDRVNHVMLKQNHVSRCSYGLKLFGVDYVVTNNVINTTSVGVYLENFNNSIIENNVLIGPGFKLDKVFGNLISNNTVNGKPLVYIYGKENISISGELGQVIILNSSSIIVKNVNITGTNIGIHIAYSNDISIVKSVISENSEAGILLSHAYNLTMTYCNIIDNKIGLKIVSNSTITAYLNNFINNNQNAQSTVTSPTKIRLDNGLIGNYWDDYVPVDQNGDMIGDAPYETTIIDNNPIVGRIGYESEMYYSIITVTTPRNTTYIKVKVLNDTVSNLIIKCYYRVKSNSSSIGYFYSITLLYDEVTGTYYAESQYEEIDVIKLEFIIPDSPPKIKQISWLPYSPSENETITVFAEIEDDYGVNSVKLGYYNGTYHNVSMVYDEKNNVYVAVIPGQKGNITLIIRVYAEDTGGNWAVSPLYFIVIPKAETIDSPPQINGVVWTPANPTYNETLTIYAQVLDDKGLNSVILSYYDGSWHNITMSPVDSYLYKAVIEISPDTPNTIIFKIYATDNFGHTTVSQIYAVNIETSSENPTPIGEIGETGGTDYSSMILLGIALSTLAIIGSIFYFNAKRESRIGKSSQNIKN